jgi:hypothetical protein
MEIIWTDRVKNEVLHRVKEERNILHAIKGRNANWIGHILCRDGLLKHVIEVWVEGSIGRDRKDGEEDVSNYQKILKKRQDTGN